MRWVTPAAVKVEVPELAPTVKSYSDAMRMTAEIQSRKVSGHAIIRTNFRILI
jgi:hypothetical protein